MAHDVFISYSFDDQTDAEEIVNKLTTVYGISCWICTRDILKGAHYKREIAEAIETCQVVVLIQSKHAVESSEIPKEIGIALEEEKKIIPFRIDTAKLKNDLRYDLTGVEYIDATIPTKEQRIYDLAKSISNATGKPLLTEQATQKGEPVLKAGRITCSEVFAGRDQLIAQIQRTFEDRNVVFLHGMGGIGKSELARQYWKAHKDSYDTAVFARYNGSLAALIADDSVFCVKGAARKTKDGNVAQSDEEYARDKLAILKASADRHTLIILDNFDVPVKEDPFIEEVISDADYHILVTTRCEPDVKKYPVIGVGEIDDATLKSLFITYANPKKTIIEEDDPDFDELFRLTNRHTYTLELVAKHMEENDEIDYLSEMIDYLKEHGFNALQVDGYDNICKLFRFTALDETEKYFLRCLAMMPPAGIHQKFFKKWIGSAFSVRSRLVDLSLVKINGETRTIALHPVIREVVCNELKPSYETCREFMNKCAMVGEDAVPLMWALPYQDKAMLLECYANFAQCIREISANTYPLFSNMSCMYNYIAPYSMAIALLERIYRFVCSHYGAQTKEAMLVYNRIGWKTYNSRLYEKALPYYQAAADWFFENPCYTTRLSHDVIWSCANLLHVLYKETKDPEYLEKSWEYLEKGTIYGQNMIAATSHMSETFQLYAKYQVGCMSRGYLNLYMDEKNYALAEEYLEKYRVTVEEFSATPLGNNADIASYYHKLGDLKYQTGDYQESKAALETAYRIYLRFFSVKNARNIDILEELADCCVKLQDYPGALQYLTTALENAQAIFTSDHPTLMRLQQTHKQVTQACTN